VRYCGKRVPYFKHHTGICMRAPHSDDVEHLVEVVTPDTRKVDYGGTELYLRNAMGRQPTVKVELYPHQEKAVSEMHNGCILGGDVGVGKTITALAYALLREPGKKIFVITTAKKRDSGDWEHEAARLAVPVDGIVVDSWNNISKYINEKNAFFIFDEQRLVGTGTWVQSFYKIARNNNWILLSATPGDNWLDYVPVFIANGFYKNITEFRNRHVIYSRFSQFPKVQRYVDTGILQRRRKLLLVEMPLERHTTRHIHMVECDYDQLTFERVWKRRWNVFTDEPIKDAGELFRVARKVVNSDESRLEQLRELMIKHPKLVVFYNFDYELEMLRSLANTQSGSTEQMSDWEWLLSPEGMAANDSQSGTQSSTSGTSFAIAEWNGHKHEPIPETDSWLYLVQYTSGSEGWNCIDTDAMVFYSLTYSYKQFYQSQGRIDRMNTPFTDLHYYVLTTKSIADRAVWRALKQKKDFNVRGLSRGFEAQKAA